MVPSRVLVVEEFPVNANGKVDRKQLAEQLAAERDTGAEQPTAEAAGRA